MATPIVTTAIKAAQLPVPMCKGGQVFRRAASHHADEQSLSGNDDRHNPQARRRCISFTFSALVEQLGRPGSSRAHTHHTGHLTHFTANTMPTCKAPLPSGRPPPLTTVPSPGWRAYVWSAVPGAASSLPSPALVGLVDDLTVRPGLVLNKPPLRPSVVGPRACTTSTRIGHSPAAASARMTLSRMTRRTSPSPVSTGSSIDM